MKLMYFYGSYFTPKSNICKQGYNQGPYLQYFIFFLTYEWANKTECYIKLG
jgi:hypothetical protein